MGAGIRALRYITGKRESKPQIPDFLMDEKADPRLIQACRFLTERLELRILGPLGAGGEGLALLAKNSEGKKLVVKLHPKRLLLGDMSKEGKSMLNEERALERLDPNFVPKHYGAYDLPEQGCFATIREYVEGQTLRERIKEQGKLTEGEVARIMEGVLHALEYLHGLPKPVIHRDIKPENIVLTQEGVRLIDFGAAKTGEQTFTTFTLKGTLRYMPLDQFGEGKPNHDFYALGVTCIEALIGRIPQDLEEKKGCTLPSDSGISRKLKKILMKMVHPVEKKRFGAVEELREALNDANLLETSLVLRKPGAISVSYEMAKKAGARTSIEVGKVIACTLASVLPEKAQFKIAKRLYGDEDVSSIYQMVSSAVEFIGGIYLMIKTRHILGGTMMLDGGVRGFISFIHGGVENCASAKGSALLTIPYYLYNGVTSAGKAIYHRFKRTRSELSGVEAKLLQEEND